MDCVRDAYRTHMLWLEDFGYIDCRWQRRGPWKRDGCVYRLLKVVTHGTRPQYTKGSTVPFIVGVLARLHGLCIDVQHDTLLTPEVVAQVSSNPIQRWLARRCPGEAMRPPTLAPAIYLMVNAKHAVFSEEVPQGLVHMAIQIRKG